MKKYIALIFLYSQLALAGTISGNGGDKGSILSDSLAWFYGPSSIRYCIQVDESFPVSRPEVSLALQASVSKWWQYIHIKMGLKNQTEKFLKDFPTYSFQEVSCQDNVELRVLFGVENEEVRKAKKMFVDPVAFAHPDEPLIFKKRNTGIIWVKSSSADSLDLTKPNTLQGILTHELGHVLGISHIRGTVMDQKVIEFYRNHGQNPKALEIDQSKFLFKGGALRFSIFQNKKAGHPVVEKILQRSTSAPAQLLWRSKVIESRHRHELIIHSETETLTLEFKRIETLSYLLKNKLFRTNKQTMAHQVETSVAYRALTPDGRELIFIEDENIGNAKLALYLFEPASFKRHFIMKSYVFPVHAQ